MRILFTILILLEVMMPAVAQNSWNVVANFNNNRLSATAFSIGSTGYVGLGKQVGTNIFFNDFWAYDTTSNLWSPKASLPSSPRSGSGSFVINGKAYIIGGENNLGAELDEVWEYDPTADSWTQKNDFPGGARRNGFCFAIGNYGYFGSGITASGTSSDCWQYDPLNDSWNAKANFPSGLNHSSYASFSIGQFGYVVGGLMFNSSSVTLSETWSFDPAANSWIQKADYPHPVGHAASFVVNGKGYVTGGNSTSPIIYYNDLNQYDPVSNIWVSKAQFPGSARSGPSAFSIGSRGFAGSGFSANLTMYSDWYRYTSDDTTVTHLPVIQSKRSVTVFPNPSAVKVTILNGEDSWMSIIDDRGKPVFKAYINDSNHELDVNFLSRGTYYLRLIKKNIKP